jgi:hypothetical protein
MQPFAQVDQEALAAAVMGGMLAAAGEEGEDCHAAGAEG